MPGAFQVNGNGRVVDELASSQERMYALWTHLALLSHLIIGFPVVASLIMWLIKRDESPFLDDHGREAVNFQLSLVIHFCILFVLGFITCGVAFMLLPVLWVVGIIGMCMAAAAANRGEYYRYPMTFRFLR